MKSKLPFAARATYCTNPTAQRLCQVITKKASNLALAADLNQQPRLLQLIEQVGPEICLLKTHIDIITDFEPTLITALQKLAAKHEFLLFEDRKFTDIGYTVKQQYSAGIYRIVEWADIVTANLVPGPDIIQGLKEVGLAKHRGLLLVAAMSPSGQLAEGTYTETCIKLAIQQQDFVIGFITQGQLVNHPALFHLTPGVQRSQIQADALGQCYVDPEWTIKERGSDIIIVGRGIYDATDPKAAAQYYRQLAWASYTACC